MLLNENKKYLKYILFNINGLRFGSEIKKNILETTNINDIIDILLFVEDCIVELYLYSDKIKITPQSNYSTDPYTIEESVYQILFSELVIHHIASQLHVNLLKNKNEIMRFIKYPSIYYKEFKGKKTFLTKEK